VNSNLYDRALGVLRRGTRPHYVYFILSREDAVKIGTTTDPDARLMALRNDNTKRPRFVDGGDLRLLGWVEGDHELETLLHRAFADYRIVGEWFSYPDIEQAIRQLLNLSCLCRGCQMERTDLAHI
jgi:predicted GIY-YIG superfamily endonuclease